MESTQNQLYTKTIITVLAWVAVLLQFYVKITSSNTDITETIIQFLSYFTILTNILVAICFTSLLLPGSRLYSFFSRNTILTAVTAYILVVGLVYNLVLRSLWDPKGLQLVADSILHNVTPLLTLLYWFFFVSVKNIGWQQTTKWMLFPFIYLIFVMIRGSFSNFYPYFFVDVSNLGYTKAFLNAGYVTLIFLFISLLLLFAGKKKRV